MMIMKKRKKIVLTPIMDIRKFQLKKSENSLRTRSSCTLQTILISRLLSSFYYEFSF